MREKGYLISFEGVDGCSKSTQAVLLKSYLEQHAPVVLVRDPGGTEVGEEIRTIVKAKGRCAQLTELLLFSAARAQLIDEVIKPALAAGKIVICDRFLDSTVAYQGYGRKLPLGTVISLVDMVTRDCVPNLTIFLDAPLGLFKQRTAARKAEYAAPDAFDLLGDEFMNNVQHGFQIQARSYPKRIVTIDASGMIDEVAARIREVVVARLSAAGLQPPQSQIPA